MNIKHSNISQRALEICFLFIISIPITAHSAKITLKPENTPPATGILIKGQGFSGNEKVTIFFDGTESASTTSTSTGSFNKLSLQIPASTPPGTHTIKAAGDKSGLAAYKNVEINTDWSQYGFDEKNSGFNPKENILTPTNVSKLVFSESFSYDSRARINAPPVIIKNIMYVGTSMGPTGESALQAIDRNGKQLWFSRIKKTSIVGLAYSEGRLVTIGTDGVIRVFKSRNGHLLWSKRVTEPSDIEDRSDSAPTVSEGIIYLSGNSGDLLAYKLENGAKLWAIKLNNDEGGITKTGKPSLINNRVIFYTSTRILCPVLICGHNELNAVDAKTGLVIWTKSIPAWIKGVTCTNNKIVVAGGNPGALQQPGSMSGYLAALEPSEGMTIWEYHPLSQPYYGEPSTSNDMVYVSNDKTVSAFDIFNGSLIWITQAPEPEFIGQSRPIIANNLIFMSINSNDHSSSIWILDSSTGGLVNILKHAGDLPPIIKNGLIHTSSRQGYSSSWGLSNP